MFKGSLSIKQTLLIAFVVLALVNLSAYFLLYAAFDNENVRVRAVERNKVLSQKIAYYSNLYAQGNGNARIVAEDAMETFDASLVALRDGKEMPGMSSAGAIESADGKALAKIEQIGDLWNTYKINAEIVLAASLEGIEANAEVEAALSYINNNANLLLEQSHDLANLFLGNSEDRLVKARMLLGGSMLLLLITLLSAMFYIDSSLLQPVNYFKQKLQQLAAGDYEQQVNFRGKKEYNQMGQYLGQVFNKLRLMTSFIESIGQGNLDYQLDESKKEIVKNDKIFNALEKTQSELIKVEQENQTRQWANEGIRMVSELLQKRYDHVQELYDELIATIVKYVEGNQGGMFLVDGEGKDIQLELSACYAYERKKFLHEKFDIDEGLLGQAFKEKSLIYLTEVPDQYVKITSGLGRSTPDSLILVPLKDNETIVGVMEIAAFGKLPQYRIEFLEKISELIASALNTIIVNEKTKSLLSESQQQAEEMRAQEEEMRQNMEELQATQEEMARKEKEITKLLDESSDKERKMQELLNDMRGKERFLDNLINVSGDSILAVNKEYRIVSFNKQMQDTYKASGINLAKNLDILSTFPDEEMKNNFRAMFDKALNGEFIETTMEIPGEDGELISYLINYAPLKSEKGDVTAAVMYSKDITELAKSRKEAEKLLAEAHQQAEEMKTQEEVLKMNMEEMKAQEEELKQQMEEMTTIQEELENRAKEAEKAKESLELENAMFTGLMDVLNDRITIKDKRGAYLRVNKTKEDSMKSAGIKEYAGRTDADIFGKDHYQKSFDIEKKIMDSGKALLNEESKAVMKDGTVIWGTTSRAPFKNQRGEVLGTLVITRDVTKEKDYEIRLQSAEKEVLQLKRKINTIDKKK